jgi:hypothetical protein
MSWVLDTAPNVPSILTSKVRGAPVVIESSDMEKAPGEGAENARHSF